MTHNKNKNVACIVKLKTDLTVILITRVVLKLSRNKQIKCMCNLYIGYNFIKLKIF